MNEFQIGATRGPMGWIAIIRKPHKAEMETIKAKGGQPIVYPTQADAKAAAGDAIIAWLNGNLVRDGETLSTGVRAAAEAVFRNKGQ